MLYIDPTSAGLALITLIIIGFYNGFKTKRIQNRQLKELEAEIKNGATKIDMSKYQHLDAKIVQQRLGHLANFSVI